MFGGPAKEEKKTQKAEALIADDAIVIEDDAIVIEEDDAIVASSEPEKQSKPRKDSSNIDALNALIGGDKKESKRLTEGDKAILAAANQKPLWIEEGRTKFTRNELLDQFVEQKEIDFSLFDKDYITMFEVFNQTCQGPFANDPESDGIDIKRFQDRTGGAAKGRGDGYKGTKAGWNANSKDWQKTNKPALQDGEEEDEPDPDWIEFDPEANKTKFFGHVMHDE